MRPPRLSCLTLTLLLSALSAYSAPIFNPRDFGAAGDGKTKDTEAIQRAIDAAGKEAGTVLLDRGIFLSGTLLLKTGVTLRIEKGATLLGSTKHDDYRKNRWMALIEAKDQHNITITGSGVIDGQGEALAADVLRLVNEKKIVDPLASNRPAEPNRPQLIEIVNCTDVTVKDVTLKNSSCWVQTYIRCDRLTLDHVTVRSTAYWNNDGLDIVDCHKATVTHCDIDSADDGICLKSGEAKQGGCEDILVEDCAIRSSASAFKFGTSSRGGFRRITARRLRIHDTFRAAIAIESVDGAVVDGVDISDVQAKNTGNAIFIRLGHRNKEGEPGSIRNVRISDVTVEIPATPPDANYPRPGPPVRAPHNLFPSSITGLPGHPVGNVALKNITITFAGGGRRDVAEVPFDRLSSIPEQSDHYPEFSMFGELPAWGFYVRHAENVTFENVSLRATAHDFRSAMVFDDAQKVTLDTVHIEGVGDNPIIVTKDVGAMTLLKTDAPAGAKDFIRDLTSHPKTSSAISFGDDLKFLKEHKETIVLTDKTGAAQVAVIPAYQGRVMTSTANGPAGLSFGWINRELIGSGETKKHINAVGGEDRIWLGPEGGQFGLFFEKGAPFDLEHWFTPPAIDTEPFEVVLREPDHVEFQRKFSLTNASGSKFDVAVTRQVRLLSPDAVWKQLGIAQLENVKMVAIESISRLTNTGERAWKKETGLLSIWILGMFNPSPATTIVIPINPGPESRLGKPVNADYFGPIPPDRLVARENAIYFKGDGKYRSKIGILPKRATPMFGSYDAENKVLTLISYNQAASNAGYVNSQWKIQEDPFSGDVVNSYNDGPPAPGAKPLGPFYEMETSSPAAALAKGQTLEHIHRTIHIQGSEQDLDAIARATLHVGINDIATALPTNVH